MERLREKLNFLWEIGREHLNLFKGQKNEIKGLKSPKILLQICKIKLFGTQVLPFLTQEAEVSL